MIVVCEGCQKRFQLDDARIPAKGARVRCKHCHHRFRVPPPGEAQAEASPASVDIPPEVAAAAGNDGAQAAHERDADDPLFGNGAAASEQTERPGLTGGAPIDGDRSLFGSMDAEDADESGGLTQELQFVSDVPSEYADEALGDAPESAPEPTEAAEEDVSAAGTPVSPENSAAETDLTSGETSEVSETSPSEPEGSQSRSEEAPGVEAEAGLEAGAAAEPDSESTEEEPTSTAMAQPEPDSEEASPSGPSADASQATSVDSTETLSEPESPAEDSWEFVESELSFDEELHTPPASESEAPEPATAPVSAESPEEIVASDADGDTLEGMQLDPGASHSGSDAAPLVDENPSMRAVGPGAGPDATTFEMVEGEGDSPLELEDGSEGAAALPEDPAPAEPAGAEALDAGSAEVAPEAASEGPEIGTAADWDRLSDDAEAIEPTEGAPLEDSGSEPTPLFASESVAAAPDLSGSSEDLPEFPPPPVAREGNPLLQHAGWALSLILLLSVAQGTVRITPTTSEGPAGQVELEGLTAEDVRGRFVENANSGTLFVVSGELKNLGTAPRSATPLRVVLLDEHGFPFEGAGAPVGYRLTEELVRETPVGALQQRAQGLHGREIGPGEGIRFQAFVAGVPEAAVRFRVEAAPPDPKSVQATLGPSETAGTRPPG